MVTILIVTPKYLVSHQDELHQKSILINNKTSKTLCGPTENGRLAVIFQTTTGNNTISDCIVLVAASH